MLVDAIEGAVSNAPVFTELAVETMLCSVCDTGLSKDMKIHIQIIKEFGMKRQVLQLIRHEAMAVPAERFNIHIHMELFSLRIIQRATIELA